MRVTIVIPAHNAQADLEACLAAARASLAGRGSIIVVDDRSTDQTREIALRCGAALFSTAGEGGAAAARNVGARAARDPILFFVDADCCLAPDAVTRVLERFAADPKLDALFGAYDERPAAAGLVSEFRNLLHTYTHRVGDKDAATFWTGCGAMRRDVFERLDGFDESWDFLEDIELGLRLKRAGGKILLDPAIEAQHRKRWTLGSMILTDIFGRAVPWTKLLLRERELRNDLNLRWTQRASVALTMLAPVLLLVHPLAALAALALVFAMNVDFYRFLARVKSPLWTLGAFGVHLVHHAAAAVGLVLGIVAAQRETAPASRPKAISRAA
jgi:GT2 family glycosyltransferase